MWRHAVSSWGQTVHLLWWHVHAMCIATVFALPWSSIWVWLSHPFCSVKCAVWSCILLCFICWHHQLLTHKDFALLHKQWSQLDLFPRSFPFSFLDAISMILPNGGLARLHHLFSADRAEEAADLHRMGVKMTHRCQPIFLWITTFNCEFFGTRKEKFDFSTVKNGTIFWKDTNKIHVTQE